MKQLTYPFTEAEFKAAHGAWGCNCGPTALAFALQKSLEDVRPVLVGFEERRYTNPTMMRGAVAHFGQETGDWLARLADHGQGTALIFARTETEMFHRYVWERATSLLFLRGRLHFHYPDGRRAKGNAGGPTVLCAYGEFDAAQLAACGLAGAFVRLRWPAT